MLRRDPAHSSATPVRDRRAGDARDGATDPLRRQLLRQLDSVAARICLGRWLWCVAAAWLPVLAVVAALRHRPAAAPFAVGALVVVAVGILVAIRRSPLAPRDVARRVERRFPDLDARLLAIVDSPPTASPRFLETQLLYQVLAHARHNDWSACVPARRLLAASALHMAGAILLGTLFERERGESPVASITGEPAAESVSADAYRLTVEPGDAEVERGTSPTLFARFEGRLPGSARLSLSTTGDSGPRGDVAIELRRHLADPVFAAKLPPIAADAAYVVHFDEHQSREYRLKVFDYPAVERIDALVTLPAYTGLVPEPHDDVARLTVVEGAHVSLTIHVNKPLRSETSGPPAESRSVVLSTEGDESPVVGDPTGDSRAFAVTLSPRRSSVWRIELTDADGRRGRAPLEFPIAVVPNRRPDIKVAFPGRDLRASPLEELDWEGTVRDDFGLVEFGVEVTVAGRPAETIPLGADVPRRVARPVAHLLALETKSVAPDDLVAWCFYADDFAADGTRRRTHGDLYFVEIRHFDETFREGQSPPGGGQSPGSGGQKNEIDQLIERQKQIVQATWRLARHEEVAGIDSSSPPSVARSAGGGEAPTPATPRAADLSTIADAQKAALAQARELDPNDARARQSARAAVEAMSAAVAHLDASRTLPEKNELADAVVAEQSAYRHLLALKAREHTVVKGSGGGGGGGSGRSSEQLQQLELTNKENRYQTERKAGSKEDDARREQLQVLNRLRELARRQSDMNQKLRELEHELRMAKTEEEQAEIRRRLKRLRDDQRELVRDLDDVRDRMDRPENEERMADARQALDEARTRLKQSSDELERGQTSKALSSGQRAERDLDRLHDDFRKKTAPQFADAVQRLRQQARDVARHEDELAKELQAAQSPADPRKSLRAAKRTEQVEQKLAEQRDRLQQLMDDVRGVVEQAEAAEPLLSQKLYDTARKSRDHQPDANLDAARKHVQQQRLADAAQSEQKARRGIEELEAGISKAAESILGDETEALRRARDELAELSNAVRDELAKESGDRSQETGVRSGKSAAEETEGGRQGSEESATGEKKPGERKDDGLIRTADASDSSATPSRRTAGSGESSPKPMGSAGEKPGNGPPMSNPSSEGKNPGEGSPSQSGGSTPGSSAGSSSGAPSESSSGSPSGLSPSSKSGSSKGGLAGGPGSGDEGGFQPITGTDFQEFSDRLRDVEEMLSDDKLKADVARIREQARSLRAEFKRHAQEPNWDLVRTTVVEPLSELQHEIARELANRESRRSLVPLDRDPVPERFTDLVRKYYERLGRSESRNEER